MGEILSTITTSFSMDTSPHPIILSFPISQPVLVEFSLFLLQDLHKFLPSSPLSNLLGCLLQNTMETTVLVTLVLIFLTQKKARKLNVELNNGRAAMLGIIGNMVAEELTGQTMYEQYAAGHISPFGDGQGFLNEVLK